MQFNTTLPGAHRHGRATGVEGDSQDIASCIFKRLYNRTEYAFHIITRYLNPSIGDDFCKQAQL